MTDPTDAVSGLREVCELNMSEEIQAELLRKIPEVPEVALEMSGGSADLEVGQTARLAVTTNVFDAAITLETSGSTAAELTVCEGPGSLEGNRLAVSGDDATTPETVTLCATGTRSGDMSVSARSPRRHTVTSGGTRVPPSWSRTSARCTPRSTPMRPGCSETR